MAEPLSTILATKALSIAIDRIIDLLIHEVDVTRPALKRIEAEVQALKDAYLLDAIDCLRDNDVLGYKRAARAALNRNRFNARARTLYADALLREGHWDDAVRTFQESVDWYGIECPLLPEVIRKAYAVQNGDDLVLTAQSYAIESRNSHGTHLKRVAVSEPGVIIAWQYHNLTLRGFTTDTRITLHRWGSSPTKGVTICYATDKSNERPLYWITDRVLLHSVGTAGLIEAVDLLDLGCRSRLSIEQARSSYGEMAATPGIAATGHTRGLSVKMSDEMHYEEGSGSQYSPGHFYTITRLQFTNARAQSLIME